MAFHWTSTIEIPVRDAITNEPSQSLHEQVNHGINVQGEVRKSTFGQTEITSGSNATTSITSNDQFGPMLNLLEGTNTIPNG